MNDRSKGSSPGAAHLNSSRPLKESIPLSNAIRQIRNALESEQREKEGVTLSSESKDRAAAQAIFSVVSALAEGKISAHIPTETHDVHLHTHFWRRDQLALISSAERKLLSERNMNLDTWAVQLGAPLPPHIDARAYPYVDEAQFRRWLHRLLLAMRERTTIKVRTIVVEALIREASRIREERLTKEQFRRWIEKKEKISITAFNFREAVREASKKLGGEPLFLAGRPKKKP